MWINGWLSCISGPEGVDDDDEECGVLKVCVFLARLRAEALVPKQATEVTGQFYMVWYDSMWYSVIM